MGFSDFTYVYIKYYRKLELEWHCKNKTVLCPRCGNVIIYEVRANSIAVECKAKNY